jgi:hypothetical protein
MNPQYFRPDSAWHYEPSLNHHALIDPEAYEWEKEFLRQRDRQANQQESCLRFDFL